MKTTDESGAALLSVLGLTLVVLLLAGVAFSVALQAQRQAGDFSQYNAALSAADAGLDDYLARLNRVPGYYATFNEGNPGDNPALDGWSGVPDSPGEYHVDVDASLVNQAGTVTVQSTGRFGDAQRTVETTFRPDGFLDFIYFTEYEILDPIEFGNDPDDCNEYSYNGRDDSDCGIIRFVTNDLIRGPFHTNDGMVIDGDPVFEGEATTSYPGADGVASAGECSSDSNKLYRDEPYGGAVDYTDSDPDFQDGLCFSAALPVPSDNQSIQDQTTNSSPATAGCAYYGPTYIRFYDPDPSTPNDGRMVVRSPWSVSEPAGAIPKNDANCGSDAALASDSGADIPIPPNGVIYVDDHTDVSCTNDSSGHPLDLPRPSDTSFYGCDVGDAFVWGEVDGQVTVGTQNNINIVWDLVYSGDFPDTDDLTGLVSNNNVQTYHPVNGGTNLAVWGTSGGNNLAPFGDDLMPNSVFGATTQTWEDPMIHAAIMAVRHSFRVHNHAGGERFSGDLSIRGAIAQFYRGAVGTSGGALGGTGYFKDYVYDDRLQFLSPPYFVQPGGETTWKAKTWAEITVPGDLP